MLNTKNYIEMIDMAINNHFQELEKAIKKCDELKEARKKPKKEAELSHKNLNLISKFWLWPSTVFKKVFKNKSEMTPIKRNMEDDVCDDYRTIEPLTIGLFGEWGSGKTHLLKGVKHLITERLKSKKQETNGDSEKALVIPILFNAWRFEKEEHMIIPLFQTLLSELENYDYIPIIKLIKTKIKVLSVALVKNLQMPKGFDIAKLFAGDISSVQSVVSFFNWKGVSDEVKKQDKNHQLEQVLSSERIESVYMKIPEWIEKITIVDNVRFVFLIDDLDRCLPENTLKMLESIKLFLDVAGCSFVLAVDDDVVERGVEHHYRDYLHKNDNHIYVMLPNQELNQESSQDKNAVGNDVKNNEDLPSKQPFLPTPNHHTATRRELPITGSEYLEKMIQLPFRIPAIDSEDVKIFLQERYVRFKPKKDEAKKADNPSEAQNLDAKLLEFFAHTIPAKPRKIIRTISLYESKEALMKSLLLEVDAIFLAKLTLLELFAPKLFRFMQSKGVVYMFEHLIDWKERFECLSETDKIPQYIKDNIKPQIDQETFLHLKEILEAHYKNRGEFNLDVIFKEKIDQEKLKIHTSFKAKIKPDNTLDRKLEKRYPADKNLFLERLFSQDKLLWVDAFEQDAQLKQSGVVLDDTTFNELLEQLKRLSKESWVQNPIWLENLSMHLNDHDFKKLLTQHNPFTGEEG